METVFDALWTGTKASWRNGNVVIDRHLKRKSIASQPTASSRPAASSRRPDGDTRRGLSLIMRPGPDFAAALAEEAAALTAVAGSQYPYPAADLHVTLLTLVSGTPGFAITRERIDRYRARLGPVFSAAPPFGIAFTGLTASSEAVMVKASAGDAIARLRESLRAGLAACGLAEGLDKRYRSEGAHATVMRFTDPVADVEALIGHIESRAQADFGQARIDEIEWVENDWYMSSDTLERLAVFPLAG